MLKVFRRNTTSFGPLIIWIIRGFSIVMCLNTLFSNKIREHSPMMPLVYGEPEMFAAAGELLKMLLRIVMSVMSAV